LLSETARVNTDDLVLKDIPESVGAVDDDVGNRAAPASERSAMCVDQSVHPRKTQNVQIPGTRDHPMNASANTRGKDRDYSRLNVPRVTKGSPKPREETNQPADDFVTECSER